MMDTAMPGKEKLAKVVGVVKGPEKARCVQWRPSKAELIVGYENGQVMVWSSQTGAPLCTT